MSVLITGGTGFIGLSLAEALLQRGKSVILFGIDPPPLAAQALTSLEGRVATLPGDVRDSACLDALFRDFAIEQVVHAAALSGNVGLERRDPREVMENNLIGAISALEAATRHLVRRFVLLSSVAAFGAVAYRSQPLSEDTPAQPDTLYAIADHAAERSALRIKRLSGLDVIVLRLGSVFGRWERESDTASPHWLCWHKARSTLPIRLPRPGIADWLYTNDLAVAVTLALEAERPRHELYHISGASLWSIADWCALLARRYPQLSVSLTADPTETTIDLPGSADRAPLHNRRFSKEFGFHPLFDLEAAFADFMAWHDR